MSDFLKNCKDCCLALGLAVFGGLFLIPISLSIVVVEALNEISSGGAQETAAIIILIVVLIIVIIILILLVLLVAVLVKVAKEACSIKKH